jgi:tetratricopeptide (TPR) repeat protein
MTVAAHNRCRAVSFASLLLGGGLALGGSDALGRDTAGPSVPRAPARVSQAATRPATPAASAAGSAGGSGSASAPSPASRPTVTATATPASAPPEPDAPASGSDDAERAKQLYSLGAEAFAARRNADAIRYFRRAAEIVPSAKLTYNIGLAYEEMGDAGRALAEYRGYLTQEQDADAERAAEVRARIASLEARLAETGVQQLFVSTDPPGATVRIAGRALGVTPWAGELPPGQHVVDVDLPGYAAQRSEVTVAAARSTELSLSLPRTPRDIGEAQSQNRVSPLAWTFLGVGAGALGGGLAFELSRAGSSRDAERAVSPIDAAEARGAADAKQMASLLLFGFGAGFTIGGSVLLALDLSEPNVTRSQTALGLPCAPEFCGLLARGRF